jgi:hypothetical protein
MQINGQSLLNPLKQALNAGRQFLESKIPIARLSPEMSEALEKALNGLQFYNGQASFYCDAWSNEGLSALSEISLEKGAKVWVETNLLANRPPLSKLHFRVQLHPVSESLVLKDRQTFESWVTKRLLTRASAEEIIQALDEALRKSHNELMFEHQYALPVPAPETKFVSRSHLPAGGADVFE